MHQLHSLKINLVPAQQSHAARQVTFAVFQLQRYCFDKISVLVKTSFITVNRQKLDIFQPYSKYA